MVFAAVEDADTIAKLAGIELVAFTNTLSPTLIPVAVHLADSVDVAAIAVLVSILQGPEIMPERVPFILLPPTINDVELAVPLTVKPASVVMAPALVVVAFPFTAMSPFAQMAPKLLMSTPVPPSA